MLWTSSLRLETASFADYPVSPGVFVIRGYSAFTTVWQPLTQRSRSTLGSSSSSCGKRLSDSVRSNLTGSPNAPSSSNAPELQSLKKRITDLEKAHSRSPRRSGQKQASIAGGPSVLALPAPSAPAQGGKGGKGNNNKRPASSSSQLPSGARNFDYLMSLPMEFRSNFHEKFHKNEICYNFQRNRCKHSDGKCKFAGCGGSKPYDDCRCLTSKIH